MDSYNKNVEIAFKLLTEMANREKFGVVDESGQEYLVSDKLDIIQKKALSLSQRTPDKTFYVVNWGIYSSLNNEDPFDQKNYNKTVLHSYLDGKEEVQEEIPQDADEETKV